MRPIVTRARPEDLEFVLATERLPGYERVVGRWEAEVHRAAIADPSHAYFVARQGVEPAGFAILRGWNSPERVTLLKRIAVAAPGGGVGAALLGAIVERVFAETAAHRLWLGVYPDNLRARRAYEAAGFRAEGVARGSAWFGGEPHDELIMAILRSDRPDFPPTSRPER